MSSTSTSYLCRKCQSFLPIESFYQRTSNSRIITTACKTCKRNVEYKYLCTPNGYFNKLLRDAKHSQAKRYKRKGKLPPTFDLTRFDLEQLYQNQGGNGFYSHMPLKLQPLSDWQASLERLERSVGYVKGNIVLEALEFNGGCQWSIDKVQQVPLLLAAPNTLNVNDLVTARMRNANKENRKPHSKPIRWDNMYYCSQCLRWRIMDDFYQYRLTVCKSCHGSNVYHTSNYTLRGFMRRLVTTAKSSSQRRLSLDSDTRDQFDITLDDVLDILQDQNFRCKYSGIPMHFQSRTDWQCSLERKDNLKGYTKDNCVLICWEFNSIDRTFGAINPMHGSSQWNEDKFKYFYRTRFTN